MLKKTALILIGSGYRTVTEGLVPSMKDPSPAFFLTMLRLADQSYDKTYICNVKEKKAEEHIIKSPLIFADQHFSCFY